jgi:glycosyltransferase involved in cell wall biosynthesis
MACGKPIISVPLVGVKDSAGDRVLYANGSDELKVRIKELLDNCLRSKLGDGGREFVLSNYSWESICNRYEETINELAVK